MQNIPFILVLMAIGVGLRRVAVFPRDTGKTLSLFVIYVSLPALILEKVPRITFDASIFAPVLMPWAMLVVSAALVLAAQAIFRWDRPTRGMLLLLVPLGNTSFFGIPMVEAFFGRGAVQYALLYDQVGTYLALAVYGNVVAAVHSPLVKATAGSILREIVLFPPLLALAVAGAMVVTNRSFPHLVVGMLGALAATLIPLVIIAVGFRIDFRLDRADRAPIAVGLLIKLVAAPLIALGLCTAFALDGLAVRVSIFEAGMPPQIGAWALTERAGLCPGRGAAMVGVGIIVSFATLTLLFQLLQRAARWMLDRPRRGGYARGLSRSPFP